jgi:hypothetical protein
MKAIDEVRNGLDDFTVLAMWMVVERYIIG